MFYFNEGNPREPVHIHALKNGVDAKFWLWPDAVVATNDGYSAKTLRELIEIIENTDRTSQERGMNSSVRARSVRFDDDSFWVDMSDGRTLGVRLAWFPRILHATPEQRLNVTLSTRGLHWDDLDEDISVEGLLAGHGDQTRPHKAQTAA